MSKIRSLHLPRRGPSLLLGCGLLLAGSVVYAGGAPQASKLLAGETYIKASRDFTFVCWKRDVPQETQDLVVQSVRETWQRYSLLEFGWGGDCVTSPTYAHQIEITPMDARSKADYGGGDMQLNTIYKSWGDFCVKKYGRDACIRGTTVHEFGHSLGFYHEQLRDDTPSDCKTEPEKVNQDAKKMTVAWDSNSVMNYCNETRNNGGELSSGDIDGVQAAYGRGAPVDLGHGDLRAFADVTGDGRADYCRKVGNPGELFLSCWPAEDVQPGDVLHMNVDASDQYAYSSVRGLDFGYEHLGRWLADVNGDGKADFCRFVGDGGQEFLSCDLARSSGFSSNQYGFNGPKGIDRGYDHLGRWLVDVNNDGRADFCRFVGDSGQEFLSCNLAEQDGFSANAYGFNGPKGIDRGYDHLGRWLADVNDDGRADFCRFVGDGGREFLSCNLARSGGFSSESYGFNGPEGIDRGYDHLGRWLEDVSGDGRADFCRFVGDGPQAWLSCNLAKSEGFSSSFYEVNMRPGYYDGNPDGPRMMADVDGDGAADWCGAKGDRQRGYLVCLAGGSSKLAGDRVLFGGR